MITIHGNLYSSKNHTQILRNSKTGKPFVAKAKKTKQAEDGLLLQLKANKKEWERMKFAPRPTSILSYEYREFPLRVQFEIYRQTKQRFDYVNIIQSLADLMVKA